MCVRCIDFTVSIIFLFDSGSVPTVWYFFFIFILSNVHIKDKFNRT